MKKSLILCFLLAAVLLVNVSSGATVLYDAARDYTCHIPHMFNIASHHHDDGVGTGEVSYWATAIPGYPSVWRMMATPAGGGSFSAVPPDMPLWGYYFTKYGWLIGQAGWDTDQWLAVCPNAPGVKCVVRWRSGYSGPVTIEVDAQYAPRSAFDPDGSDILLYIDGVQVDSAVVNNTTTTATLTQNVTIDFDTKVEVMFGANTTHTGLDGVLFNVTVTADGTGSYAVANVAENGLNHEYEVNANLLNNGLTLVTDNDRGIWTFQHDPAGTPADHLTFEPLYGFNSGAFGSSSADGREGYSYYLADAAFAQADPNFIENPPSIEMLWDSTNNTWNYNDVLIRPDTEDVICNWGNPFDRNVSIDYTVVYIGTGDGVDFGIYDAARAQWVVPMADVPGVVNSSVASYDAIGGGSLYFVVGPGSSGNGTGDIAKVSFKIDSPMAFVDMPENDLDASYVVDTPDLTIVASNWLNDETNPNSGVLADAVADFNMHNRYLYEPPQGEGIYGERWYLPDSSGLNTGADDRASWISTCGANIYGPGYMYSHIVDAAPSAWDMFTYHPDFNWGPQLRGATEDPEYLTAIVYDSLLAANTDRSVDYRWISGVTGDITINWKMKMLDPVFGYSGTGMVVINDTLIALSDFWYGSNDGVWEGSYRVDVEPGDFVEFRLYSIRDGNPQFGSNLGLSATIEYSPCTGDGAGDVNGDCKVNMADFAELAGSWMECGIDPQSECPSN